MWFKGKGMSVAKWSKGQFLGERVLVQLFDQTYHNYLEGIWKMNLIEGRKELGY